LESTLSFDPQDILRSLDAFAKSRDRAVVVTHDNPDPDAMAGAAGLAFLLQERVGLSARLAYGGIIGRAENQAMARLIRPSLTPISRVAIKPNDLVALVDTQPSHGNHSLGEDARVDVVMDHHPAQDDEVPVAIVSEQHGATSSIITVLIRAAGLVPPPELATALFYGVKTDTRSLSREADEADRASYDWLYPQRDPVLLDKIEHPVVPRRWFEAFHRSIERARIYGNVVIADIGDVYVPDIVPEVADRLSSLSGAKWSVAFGVWEAQIYVSVRTNDGRMNAGKRLVSLLDGLDGSAGGHGMMAGAQVPLLELSYTEARSRVGEIVGRIRAEFGVEEAEPVPLIDPMEAIADARQAREQ